VAVEVLAGPVVAHRGARVGVPGSDLDIPQVHARIQHGCDVCVAEHVRVGSGDLHTGGIGEVAQAPGGGMTVHPGTTAMEQDRPTGPVADRAVDGPPDRRWQRDLDHLGALAADAQHPVAVFVAEVGNVGPVASKIRRPSRPSMATRAKAQGSWESRAAVSRASNRRWVNPRVGDSAGTAGLRTCSAEECLSRPSMTQVLSNPATTENRRDTVEGLKRRISCIHRMYNSRCGRRAAIGFRPRSAHQER